MIRTIWINFTLKKGLPGQFAFTFAQIPATRTDMPSCYVSAFSDDGLPNQQISSLFDCGLHPLLSDSTSAQHSVAAQLLGPFNGPMVNFHQQVKVSCNAHIKKGLQHF